MMSHLISIISFQATLALRLAVQVYTILTKIRGKITDRNIPTPINIQVTQTLEDLPVLASHSTNHTLRCLRSLHRMTFRMLSNNTITNYLHSMLSMDDSLSELFTCVQIKTSSCRILCSGSWKKT